MTIEATARGEPKSASPAWDLDDPALYLNRELSWLEFNERVLAEALDPRNRLLERIKFLAITASNLDEFSTKRVGWLKRGKHEHQLGAAGYDLHIRIKQTFDPKNLLNPGKKR